MIRPYNKEDAKAIRSIAYHDDDRSSMRAISAVKCDYFLDHEPEHCFVMTDEFDNPAGYILCSVDYKKYNMLFPTYLLTVKDEDKKQYRLEKRLLKKLGSVPSEYPARLSISVLPSFRGKGGARMLVTTLTEHLKEIGISGVYTVADTTSAIAFCERVGFHRIMKIDRTHFIYGILIE